LRRRDMFIAQRIAETLGATSFQGAGHAKEVVYALGISGHLPLCGDVEGGAGILFIGACHHVKSRLPKDIQVIEVKESKQVRKYQELLPFCRRRRRRFAALGRYLAASVDISTIALGDSGMGTGRKSSVSHSRGVISA